jgi:hypothetical protein
MFLESQRFRSHETRNQLSNAYHEQTFPLPAVEKWSLPFADRTRDLEDESRSEWPKRADLAGPIAQLLREKPFISCQAMSRRLKILAKHVSERSTRNWV